eukprot:FR744394.1.p2 GENE.FR744394.1~~FR744394.1.p2  ORF type:complete len:100 (-),score=23.75 FR744394.1:586-885(-)
MLSVFFVWGNLERDNNFHPGNSFAHDYAQRANLPSLKGTKGGGSAAGGAALELVDPLGSGPWLSLTAAAFFFFFFFLTDNSKLVSNYAPIVAACSPLGD